MKPVPVEVWEKVFAKMGGEDGTVDKDQLIRQMTHLQNMIKQGPPPVPTEGPPRGPPSRV